MNAIKLITPTGKMSNLVGMWAATFHEDGEVKHWVYVRGKADDTRFIVQALNCLTGEPNVARLFTIEEMKEWYFFPTAEIATEYQIDYWRKGRFPGQFLKLNEIEKGIRKPDESDDEETIK